MPNPFGENNADEILIEVLYRIPVVNMSALVSMVAIAKWVVCDHGATSNSGFRDAVQRVEQRLYEQSHACGGSDEIWQHPKDGSYHHPTFPEQTGEAWRALQEYEDKVFSMRLVEMASHMIAERNESSGVPQSLLIERNEHALLDIADKEGPEGVIRALMDFQENS